MVTKVQFVTTPAMRTVPSGLVRVMRSSTAVALNNLMFGNDKTLERRVEVKRAYVIGSQHKTKCFGMKKEYVQPTACFTTTKSPSSSKGTPRSIKKASAGLRITMALKS